MRTVGGLCPSRRKGRHEPARDAPGNGRYAMSFLIDALTFVHGMIDQPRRPVSELALEPAREPIKSAESVYLTALLVASLLQVDEKTVLRWSLEHASKQLMLRCCVVRCPFELLRAGRDGQ